MPMNVRKRKNVNGNKNQVGDTAYSERKYDLPRQKKIKLRHIQRIKQANRIIKYQKQITICTGMLRLSIAGHCDS